MKNKVIAIYSGKIYHDMDGIMCKYFVTSDGRYFYLPDELFPVELQFGDICSIELRKEEK